MPPMDIKWCALNMHTLYSSSRIHGGAAQRYLVVGRWAGNRWRSVTLGRVQSSTDIREELHRRSRWEPNHTVQTACDYHKESQQQRGWYGRQSHDWCCTEQVVSCSVDPSGRNNLLSKKEVTSMTSLFTWARYLLLSTTTNVFVPI